MRSKLEAEKRACFLPFNSRNLNISLFVFRPTVVFFDEIFETLRHFSACTKNLGCVQSSIFQSIHGNLIIWYGAWMKKSSENKEMLTTTLLSKLADVSSRAILIDYSFFDAYAGESSYGSSVARFSTGDTISMHVIVPYGGDINNLSYANLALFKSHFLKMEGAISGVCLNCQNFSRVATIFVWKSLQCCYNWILNSDFKRTMLPYLEGLSLEIKYDIFRVVYVSSETEVNYHNFPSSQIIASRSENERNDQVIMKASLCTDMEHLRKIL